VVIGQDAWIGDRAVVTANIGRHAVVGAAAVVTKPVPDFAIVVGNPARIHGFHGQENELSIKGVASETALAPTKS